MICSNRAASIGIILVGTMQVHISSLKVGVSNSMTGTILGRNLLKVLHLHLNVIPMSNSGTAQIKRIIIGLLKANRTMRY